MMIDTDKRLLTQLRAGFDDSSTMFLILDRHWKILFSNKSFQNLTQISLESSLGKSPGDLLGSDCRALFSKDGEMEGLRSFRQEEILLNLQNGCRLYVDLQVIPTHSENGEAENYLLILNNITHQKMSEQADAVLHRIRTGLSESTPDTFEDAVNEALREVGQFTGADRVYVFDFGKDQQSMDNTYEWCRSGIEPQIDNLKEIPTDYFPWWIETLLKDQIIDFESIDDMPEEAEAEQEILRQQDIRSIVVYPLKDGQMPKGYIGIDSVNSPFIPRDYIHRIFRTFSHIVSVSLKLHLTQTELIQNNRRLTMAFNSADIGLYEWELRSNARTLHTKLAGMIDNPSLKKSIDQNVWESLVHPDDLALVQNSFHRFLSGEAETFETEYRVRSGSGTYKWIRDKAWVSGLGPEGETQSLTGIVSDISNIREYEQLLHDYQQNLQTMDNAKSILLATVSHEFKTPLNAIIGLSDILMGQDIRQELKNYIKSIRTSGELLLRTVSTILDLNKLENRNYSINLRPVNLHTVINEVLQAVSSIERKRFIDFSLEIDEELPELLYIDMNAYQKILRNLLENAYKYTRQGKITLKVSCEVSEDDTLQLSMSVSDTGIGISRENHERIFSPFFREDNALSRHTEGSGLGLTQVREIVEYMGGTISLESTPGHGSTFTVNFPELKVIRKLTGTMLPEEMSTGLRNLNLTGQRIHIAEPLENMRLMYRDWIEKTGASVCASSSVQDLKNCLEKDPMDVVLLDSKLITDRDDFLSARTLAQKPEILFIVYHKRGEDLFTEQISEAFDHILNKPINLQDLISLLKKKYAPSSSNSFSDASESLSSMENIRISDALKKELLEKVAPRVQDLRDTIDLTAAEDLSKCLQSLSENYRYNFLTEIGNRFAIAVEQFDISGMRRDLDSLTEILDNIEQGQD